jgi:hypothetical protein
MQQIPVRIGIAGGGSNVNVDVSPDKCPMCHFSINALDLNIASQSVNGDGWPIVDRIFQCPNGKCQRFFIARYSRTKLQGQGHFELQSCVPFEFAAEAQTDTITKISADFCAIYAQAYKVEQHSLPLIAGPGYRKALEFLIKDYIISQFTEEDPEKKAAHKAAVEKMLLGACIAKYVKSEQIKEISKRAAWLGNDETHYVRKWEDKDLNDLKKLITLTLHWIEIEKLTADVIADMPEGKT